MDGAKSLQRTTNRSSQNPRMPGLPYGMELKTAATRWSNHLVEKREVQILESEEMNNSAWRAWLEVALLSIDNEDITATAASSDSTTLRTKAENSMDLSKILCDTYHKDAIFYKIMAHPEFCQS
jgi:hypothetical protein